MGLYDKYARLAGERLQFSDNGLTPFGTCIDEVYSATEGRIGNKKVILAGTNNYLGLTFNHDAISEGQAALAAQGTGTTGSRMANGSYAPHLALEKEIAEFFNRPTAIVFSTGYIANLRHDTDFVLQLGIVMVRLAGDGSLNINAQANN